MLKKLVFYIFFILSSWSHCSACTCVTRTFEDAIKSAEEIFLGKVIKIELLNKTTITGLKITKVTFDVIEKWKGNKETKMVLLIGGNSCDYYFNNKGSDYLVFANRKFSGWRFKDIESIKNIGEITSDACSRTTEINKTHKEEIKSEIMLLNRHFPKQIILKYNNGFRFYNILVLLGIILLVFIFLYLTIRKRTITNI